MVPSQSLELITGTNLDKSNEKQHILYRLIISTQTETKTFRQCLGDAIESDATIEDRKK